MGSLRCAKLIVGIILVGLSPTAHGQSMDTAQVSQAGNASKPSDIANRQLQEWLVWIGYYEGPIDGDLGTGTTNAVKRFQKDLKAPETGTLNLDQTITLSARAKSIIDAAGYKIMVEPTVGIRAGIPAAILTERKRIPTGITFQSNDLRAQITWRAFKSDGELKSLFERLKETFNSWTIDYSTVRNDWLVVSGYSEQRRVYIRLFASGDVISGMFVSYDKTLPKETLSPLVTAVTVASLTLQPFATAVDGKNLARSNAIIADMRNIANPQEATKLPEVTRQPGAIKSQEAKPQDLTKATPTPSTARQAPDVKPTGSVSTLETRISQLEQRHSQLQKQVEQQKSDSRKPSAEPSRLGNQPLMIITAVALAVAFAAYFLGRKTSIWPKQSEQTTSALTTVSVADEPASPPAQSNAGNTQLIPPVEQQAIASTAVYPSATASSMTMAIGLAGMLLIAIVLTISVQAISALLGF